MMLSSSNSSSSRRNHHNSPSRTNGYVCGLWWMLLLLLVVMMGELPCVRSLASFRPPAVFKKAYFGLEGFVAKRKVNKDLDPSATKFLVDSDKDFCASLEKDDDAGTTVVVGFDHSSWDLALKRHANYQGVIDGIPTTLVDYKGMADDPYFELYLKELEKVNLEELLKHAAGSSEANNELLALYINAYNCLCISHITQYYKSSFRNELPVSITGCTKTMSDYKGMDIWDIPAGKLGGKMVTLNELEHRFLRSLWDEPRIHASIVCASASCPNIRPEAFDAKKLNQQMDEQTKEWVSDNTKGIAINNNNKKTVSRIFLWFDQDFGPRGPMEWASQYYQGPSPLKGNDDDDLEYFPYNWALNAKV